MSQFEMEQLDIFDSSPGDCTFCKIVRGDMNAHLVYEDDYSLTFLDHRPLFPGHCLLVPKKHYETLSDVPPESIGPIFTAAQLVTRGVEKALEAHGTFVAINNRVSQSVPHLHIHVVPRRRKDGLKGFFWPRHPYKSDKAMQEVQTAIKSAILSVRSQL